MREDVVILAATAVLFVVVVHLHAARVRDYAARVRAEREAASLRTFYADIVRENAVLGARAQTLDGALHRSAMRRLRDAHARRRAAPTVYSAELARHAVAAETLASSKALLIILPGAPRSELRPMGVRWGLA